MRHIYTVFSTAIAIFSAAELAEAPRLEPVYAAKTTGAISADRDSNNGRSTLDAAVSHGATLSDGTVSGLAINFTDAPSALPLGNWCCSSDPNSLNVGTVTPGLGPLFVSLTHDGYAPTLDGTTFGETAFQTWIHPGNDGLALGVNAGTSALSVSTASTSAGNSAGSSNTDPPNAPASVPEPSAFLLVSSGLAAVAVIRYRRRFSLQAQGFRPGDGAGDRD